MTVLQGTRRTGSLQRESMIEARVLEILGRRLTSAGALLHEYEGHLSTQMHDLWLGFEGKEPLRFSEASDGEHLLVDSDEPEEVDMQESGRTRFVGLESDALFSPAMGLPLRRAWLVLSPGPRDVIGVRLTFETCTMLVLNWGDELYLGPNYPPDADPSILERLVAWN